MILIKKNIKYFSIKYNKDLEMSKIKIKAAIFDFDGTLVDSESLYTKSLIYMADKMKVLEDVVLF